MTTPGSPLSRQFSHISTPIGPLLLPLFVSMMLCGLERNTLRAQAPEDIEGIRVVLLDPAQATGEVINSWKQRNFEIAMVVNSDDPATLASIDRVRDATGKVDYFFEVARNPEMAEKHPEWMASIQGHHEWMRLFKDSRKPGEDEVVKVFPWVPVFNREPLEAQVDRIGMLLKKLPRPRRIWLNDIQGAPSACGCGHPLCRWTADYGPIRTATPLGDSAPATFVARIRKLAGDIKVIPILTSECEAEDQHTVCGGVGCFEGICWKAFTRQLDALATDSQLIGVACFYKAFQRDLPRYREKAGWIRYAIQSFEKMPQARNGKGVKADRLIAAIQGWEVTDEELQQQVAIVQRLKTAGVLICLARIEQGWTPRTIKKDIAK